MMDPQANLKEQLELAREIQRLVDTDVPWSTDTEFGGDSDKWGDEQDRSEYFEWRSDTLGGLGSPLAKLVIALDEWRRKGGFDPYGETNEARIALGVLDGMLENYREMAEADGLDLDDPEAEDPNMLRETIARTEETRMNIVLFHNLEEE